MFQYTTAKIYFSIIVYVICANTDIYICFCEVFAKSKVITKVIYLAWYSQLYTKMFFEGQM